MSKIATYEDGIKYLNSNNMDHTVKFDMVVADFIVQEALTHFMFSIILDDEYTTKNISST